MTKKRRRDKEARTTSTTSKDLFPLSRPSSGFSKPSYRVAGTRSIMEDILADSGKEEVLFFRQKGKKEKRRRTRERRVEWSRN